jgi:hypothetical protein
MEISPNTTSSFPQQLRTVESLIDKRMEEAPACIRWHYSPDGWQQDVVVGQMDVDVLTTDAPYALSITRWLPRDTFTEGPAAYGVRDLRTGPIIRWVAGIEHLDDLQCASRKDIRRRLHVPDAAARIALFGSLLPYGEPVTRDILQEPELNIHRRLSFRDRLQEAQRRMLSLPPELFSEP